MGSFTFILAFLLAFKLDVCPDCAVKPDFCQVEAIKGAHFQFLSRVSAKGSENARVLGAHAVKKREMGHLK